MKTVVLILAMLAAPLAAQSTSTQISQTKAPSAAQQPQTVIKPIAKPAQLSLPQQPILFTAKQYDEYENKILDRAETFYNNRMTDLLWTMGILMAIGAVVIPFVISGFIQWQRNISFKKELAQAEKKILESTKEQIKELEKELISQIDDREAKQTIAISSYLSMIFSGLGGVLSSQKSSAGYGLSLQSQVISMKFSVNAQCFGGCLTADQIINLFSPPHVASKLKLDTLEIVDGEIEIMKGDLDKIVDAEKRADMELQVKKLQIFVHTLIHEKQHDADTHPPQAGS